MMRIGVYLPACPWGFVDENAPSHGLGGRETALVNLCIEWANLGFQVYAFVPREETHVWNAMSGGYVRWIPAEHVVVVGSQLDLDLFISWEYLEVITALRKAGYTGTTAIEMQVAHLDVDTETLIRDVDKICVLSEWAKKFLAKQHDEYPIDDIIVLPNGVTTAHTHPELTELLNPETFSEDHVNFIYSSSPDRGLHHLLAMWPAIKYMAETKTGREARLHVCYGLESFVDASRWSHREDGRRALLIEQFMSQDGVVYHGRVGQDVLAGMQARSAAMTYPCDTLQGTETGCISIIESFGMRLPVVTTDCDCLGSEFEGYAIMSRLPLDYDDYIRSVEGALDSGQQLRDTAQWFAEERAWPKIARAWINEFSLLAV